MFWLCWGKGVVFFSWTTAHGLAYSVIRGRGKVIINHRCMWQMIYHLHVGFRICIKKEKRIEKECKNRLQLRENSTAWKISLHLVLVNICYICNLSFTVLPSNWCRNITNSWFLWLQQLVHLYQVFLLNFLLLPRRLTLNFCSLF